MSSERNRSLPDDLRALGLTVAIHNDYRLNDVLHTFWLITLPNEDGTALAFKGEGVNDADALDQIRAQVKRFFKLEGPAPAPPDIGVGNTLRYMRENPSPLTQLKDVPTEDKPGPPPTHLAPMVRLSDPPRALTPLEQELAHVPRFERPLPRPWPDAKISRAPGDLVHLAVGDGQTFDFSFTQACSLVEDIVAALPSIRWGEGSGPHPGEVVLAQSHLGSRRAAVRSVEGGIALRAVECDGQPAGGSIFLRDSAIDALIDALKVARNRTPPLIVKPSDKPAPLFYTTTTAELTSEDSQAAASLTCEGAWVRHLEQVDPPGYILTRTGTDRGRPLFTACWGGRDSEGVTAPKDRAGCRADMWRDFFDNGRSALLDQLTREPPAEG